MAHKRGLCLGGGGITGALYAIGCLAALEEGVEGFRASDFDVFVGTSAGATVATALAGGYPATRLYRALLDPADDFFPLRRQHLLRLDGKEWRRVATSAVRATRHLFSSAASSPLDLDVWNELD
ncbi:MAG: patatin-like phospholipase family protein, partial [Myxococcales bacterium]|nr:patatin-like phospholipase family protein [Myxococcales bacterium]